MKCQYLGCQNEIHARGSCTKHYQRLIKNGSWELKVINRGGKRNHPLYGTYFNMIARCNNPKNPNYKYYGGKGVLVCTRWDGFNGFQNFIEDMGERPEGYQLDRIDVNGIYCKENCRWVDKYTQMGNTTKSGIFPGVTWSKHNNKYRARIKVKGKEKHLGLFVSFDDAKNARLNAIKNI